MSHLSPLEVLGPIVSTEARLSRVRVDGKFLAAGDSRFLVKGVTYGTFAPDENGTQYPPLARVQSDFAAMAEAGVNTVRVYTPPPAAVLDAAAERGLRVMIGVPWAQHVAFLDDSQLARDAREGVVRHVRELASHPAAMMFAVGNEIPPGIVRWHGRRRIDRFLGDLYKAAKDAAPESLITYVNFPPTEYLDLSDFDVYAFNVYLHREQDLRAYLARLHQLAGVKPLLLAEAGADSIREGEEEQARVTAMHVRAAFAEGLCGAFAYAWTDEWWRGGQQVTDWKFGLVDAERRPKPALAAVRWAFADAPFAPAVRATWPKVTVVVCAYNASDTIGECLDSLGKLDYPNYEVIVVNDGSKDQTGDIAKSFPFARVIDIPNGGLSAARNVGCAHATGEIVAYTDSDVRVDRDWLAHLVQPFLYSDVVGSGGPNVVPPDDHWVAQCVARAPGGPTHVLLNDRIAEHVPGCNMAFRKTALDAVGGFNPIYLRAGDDVDLCWRLQARGWRVGFAPSALVWHRHRNTVKAYWKQQLGYGEGEVWLMHQHPDKFAGGHMIWRGHIYSPLPFVRALTRLRMNTGVWGLSAFPSVYHTGAEPWSFLPHSAPWHVAAALSVMAGILIRATTSYVSAGWLLLFAGLGMLGITAARCLSFARRTDLGSVMASQRGLRGGAREWQYRAMIAWLHFVQPLARMRGLLRGWLEPPQIPAVESSIPSSAVRPRPRPGVIWAALRLLGGASAEDRYWSERWVGVDQALQKVLDALSLSHVSGRVHVADGWDQRRDVSMALGRWAWFDLAAVVEEHAEGRVLVRTRTHLRPTALTVLVAVAAFAAILVAATSLLSPRWSLPSAAVIASGVAALATVAYRTAAALAALRGVVAHALGREGALPIGTGRPTVRFSPDLALWRFALRSALASLVVVGVVLGSSVLMRDAVVNTVEHFESLEVPVEEPVVAREYTVPRVGLTVAPNGDVYLADGQNDVVRRVGTTSGLMPVGLRSDAAGARKRNDTIAKVDTPGGVAVAPNGDLFIADTESHRVFRVDRVRGTTVVVAGTGKGGFAGDDGPATKAQLNEPSGVAVDRVGNLYIADAANHRIRKVAVRTGIITTIAGTGIGDPGFVAVGDGDLATKCLLSWPMDLAVASTGDIYIADTGHNRVRRIDARTGKISTVAGDGSAGGGGDGGPAVNAGLSAPTGIALVARRKQVTLYIADSSVGRVRVVTPDGIITSLALPNALKIGSPSRVAYHPRGYLYVAGGGSDAVAAVSLAPPAQPRRAPALPPGVQTPPRRAM